MATVSTPNIPKMMSNIEERNYYELLGLEQGASVDDIRTAYREIARIYHPDSNFYDDIIEDSGPNDSDVFKAITAAYNILVNDEKRQKYDSTLPKGLSEWDDQSVGIRTTTYSEQFSGGSSSEMSGQVYEATPDPDIPEEWREERAFFEEHFEEILKPAPKVNLVGDPEPSANTVVAAPGDIAGSRVKFGVQPPSEAFDPLSRFGKVEPEEELENLFEAPITSRRPLFGVNTRDPYMLIMLVGIPIVLLVVFVELYFFM